MSQYKDAADFIQKYKGPGITRAKGTKIQFFLDQAAKEIPKVWIPYLLAYKAVIAVSGKVGAKDLSDFIKLIGSQRAGMLKKYNREIYKDPELGCRASVDDPDKKLAVENAVKGGKTAEKKMIRTVAPIDITKLTDPGMIATVISLKKKAPAALAGFEDMIKRLNAGSGDEDPEKKP